MVLQLDDCVNILKVIFPGIDFIFILNHSCVHDKGRRYGLDLTNMNSGYGEAQIDMHPKSIKHNFGYLGLH